MLLGFDPVGLILQANLKFINRDAVAMILGVVEDAPEVERAIVIDLRRRDERTFYGTIPGAFLAPCTPDTGLSW